MQINLIVYIVFTTLKNMINLQTQLFNKLIKYHNSKYLMNIIEYNKQCFMIKTIC